MNPLMNSLAALAALVATAIGGAAELQAVGAIRQDHDVKWQGLRIALDQANDALKALQTEAETLATAAPTPDAAAFEVLGTRLVDVEHTLARLVDLANGSGT